MGGISPPPPRLFNLRLAQSRAEEFEGEPLITLTTLAPDGWQHLCKRTLDIALSLLALLLPPLFLLTALIVKLTSPGPAKAFHAEAQSRGGRKGKKAVNLCESLRLGASDFWSPMDSSGVL